MLQHVLTAVGLQTIPQRRALNLSKHRSLNHAKGKAARQLADGLPEALEATNLAKEGALGLCAYVTTNAKKWEHVEQLINFATYSDQDPKYPSLAPLLRREVQRLSAWVQAASSQPNSPQGVRECDQQSTQQGDSIQGWVSQECLQM